MRHIHFLFTAVISLFLLIVGCKSFVAALISVTATLGSPVYAGSTTAINNTGTATLTLTYTNVTATTLTAVSGTSAAAPAGLTVSTTGGVSCTAIAIVTPTTAGASITVSGCTGDGTVLVTVDAATGTTEGASTAASAQRSVLVQNTLPTATLAATNAAVAATSGANTVVATFNEKVKALSTTNANGEFTIGGCATPPTVAIATTITGGHSVATATLSGGTCADGDTVTVDLNLDQVTNLAGDLGDASSNPTTETYDIDTTLPTATLAAATFTGTLTGVNNSGTAELALTYANAASTTLTASTGTSSAAPTGLTVSTTGGVSCTSIAIVTPTSSGATIQVTGCTGNGTVRVTVAANTATSASGLHNVASSLQSITVQNTLPTATLAATDSVVGTADGANVITATFASLVQDLDATNSNAEFVVSGDCATPPTVAIAMSIVSGHSVATATLSGGTCADGDTVTVDLQRDQVTDIAGNVGTAGTNPTKSYTIDTTAPTATLAAPSYPSTQGAIKSGQAATLALTYTNTASQTLTASTGSTASPPAGLTVNATGATCTTVAIATPTISGATISVSGCTGDGTVDVEVDAAVATSAAGLTNAASAQQTILVENTPPTASFAGTPAVGGADGSNTLVATFSSMVADLSSTNAGGEVDITGCTTTQPTVTLITMSDDGSNHSIATIDIANGVCTSGDTVSVQLHLDNIKDKAGNDGVTNPAPETYSVP